MTINTMITTGTKLICTKCGFGSKPDDPWVTRKGNGKLPVRCPRCSRSSGMIALSNSATGAGGERNGRIHAQALAHLGR